MKKTPDAGAGAYVRGAATSPAAALIQWLDAQKLDGQPKRLRLPVLLKQGVTGWKLRGAKIGASADAVEMYCNDAALGIGLSDRVSKLCKPDAVTCAVWLVGYWRGKQDDSYQFDVTAVDEAIADPAAANHVEVEGESNN